MSRVAVVILNYNGKELLKKFLPSVIQFSSDARIVVADNNSSDGSQTFLTSEFPSVELIPIASNLGFCGGYNFALSRVTADYYVLLNSDVEVTANWLTPMTSLLDRDPGIAAVQPKILSYREKDKFEYAGAAGGYVDTLGYPFCRGRIFEVTEVDNGQFDDTVPVFWATGACMVVRANLYHSMGGLDEAFFAHMEEIDLCWRFNRAGYNVMYCGQSCVYHVGGATLDQSNPRKTYYNFRNGLTLLIKNLPTWQLLFKLPLRWSLDWVAAIRFLFSGGSKDFLAVLRAHVYIIRHLPGIARRRFSHLPYKVSNIYSGSIVFDFFVRGKRKFNELIF